METKAAVFGEIYQDYLDQLEGHWPQVRYADLGVESLDGQGVTPLFGRPHRAAPGGIIGPHGDKPSHAVCVVLAKYLLADPQGPGPRESWVSYRDFPDARPYAGGFARDAERRIAQAFSGRAAELERACRELGGRPPDQALSYDLCMVMPALPRVPLLLLFNDEEDGFPASCSLLFDHSGPDYLDMECLAILGLVLAEWLVTEYPACQGPT